jgi:hypothetical protein
MSDDNNVELKKLIQSYGLTLDDVSAYTDYSLDMVKAWISNPDSTRYRVMQDRALRLLKYEIQSRDLSPKN